MPSTRPDILLIVLDTVRRDHLTAYGHDRPTSPAFDAFAAESTLFTQAVAPAQWTVPAHASLFTGLYPGAHGITQAHHRLSGLHPTLAETLRAAGYHTAGFSSNPLVGTLDNDLTRGFTDFFAYAGAAVSRPLDRPGPLRQRWQRFARPTQNRFARSDALFRASMHPLLVPLWTRFANYKGRTDQSISDLIAYLERRQAARRDTPLFAFLNLMGAHLPYRPPQAALDAVAPGLRRDRRAIRFMHRFNAQAARWASPDNPPLADWQRAVLRAYYDAEIRAQDAHLGRLLGHLHASGALDHTLVIILADHGDGHGDHGFLGHSFVVYQELIHVPLLVRWPGDGHGTRVTAPVSTRRVWHTALEAAGAAPPLDAADPNADVRGLSLARGGAGDGGAAFAEAYPPVTLLRLLEKRAPQLINRLRLRETRRAVCVQGWKLVTVGDAVEGLFDTAADPADARDLTLTHADQVARLLSRLEAFTAAQAARAQGDSPLTAQADDAIIASLRALGYIE